MVFVCKQASADFLDKYLHELMSASQVKNLTTENLFLFLYERTWWDICLRHQTPQLPVISELTESG